MLVAAMAAALLQSKLPKVVSREYRRRRARKPLRAAKFL
jgi:hypothetical protein